MSRARRLALSAAAVAALSVVFIGEAIWIKAKAAVAQVLLDRAFAETVTTGEPVKPWSWADTWPVAKISVPRLKTSAIALAGSSGQAMAFGPGHVERTAEPGGTGTAVYAAHRDTHFAFVGQLVIGDEIRVTGTDGLSFDYRVTGTSIVRWDDSGIEADADGRNLALVTCWPLDGSMRGPLRYVVHAEMR
jgi:sortase A